MMATLLHGAPVFCRAQRFACAPTRVASCLCPRAASSALGGEFLGRTAFKGKRRLVAQPEAVATSRVEVSREDVIKADPANNIPDNIFQRIGAYLHKRADHPLCLIKTAIYDFFEQQHPGLFTTHDDLYPVVSTKANFDDVLVPPDHVSRNPNDTYYVDAQTVLRCHTSAHQSELLRQGYRAFLVTGDVYRRDTIDATHYPVFHQMEGVRVFTEKDWSASGLSGAQLSEQDLKRTLEGLAQHLFGKVEMRWVDAYFPFTEPSFELEIFFKGQWLEVLGCGVVQQQILDDAGLAGTKAWAFGRTPHANRLGLERLAMVLFDIPDIRLFWSGDKRFLKQFRQGDLSARFKPYSKFPPCYKDVSFWINPEFTENNLCEMVRSVAGDLVEEVKLIDEFTNRKTGKTSNCFRIAYRSMERSLTDDEINVLQDSVRRELSEKLMVELR